MEETKPGTDISPVTTVVVPANLGSIKYDDLLKVVARSAEPEKVGAKLPTPAKIKPSEKTAIETLPTVFGVVVPASRRVLTDEEVTALMAELGTIDVVGNLTKKRKDDIRTTLFNHWDVEYEATHTTEECAATPRNKDGHYVTEAQVDGEEISYQRTVREGTVSMDPKRLEEIAKDPEYPQFTWQDYLAMTEQTRVVREDKVMDQIRNKPELVEILSLVTTRGNKVAAFSPKKG